MDLKPIIWKRYTRTHNDFGVRLKTPEVWLEGWGVDAPGCGICTDYVTAMALNMGMWEEYVDHHRALLDQQSE